jgi:hypothetical protein
MQTKCRSEVNPWPDLAGEERREIEGMFKSIVVVVFKVFYF